MNNEYCVCCGREIPEGRQVCCDCCQKISDDFKGEYLTLEEMDDIIFWGTLEEMEDIIFWYE